MTDTRATGNAIRRARIAQGMSQTRLAELAGVSSKTVLRAESGRYGMQAFTLRKLADALAVNEGDLLTPPAPPGLKEVIELRNLANDVVYQASLLSARLWEIEKSLGAIVDDDTRAWIVDT